MMKHLKFFVALGLLVGIGVPVVVSQDARSDRGILVEESYLQEHEIKIIRESAHSESEEQKLMALEFIKDAISHGNGQEDLRASLEYLATEGTVVMIRENGRVVNDYPLIRKQVVEYLGELGTAEAKDTLIKIIRADTDPLVLAEAFKSLAKIGINDQDQTVSEISRVVQRYTILAGNKSKTDEYLIHFALEAYEQLALANGGIKDQYTLAAIADIMVGPYQKNIRDRARNLLARQLNLGGQDSENL
jgi:hypothetical protein